MEKSAIILSIDFTNKFGEDKGLIKLDNKPLLTYVIEAVEELVEEIIIVTNKKEREKSYAKMFSSKVKFACGADNSGGLLEAVLAGFEAAKGKYSLVLPFDSPFVSKDLANLLFECCIGKSAVIPRSPDNKIEPVHAVYNTKQALEAAKSSMAKAEPDLEAMVGQMRGVRYISTLVIEQIDPDFRTFFVIKTPLDLKKALIMIKPRKLKKHA